MPARLPIPWRSIATGLIAATLAAFYLVQPLRNGPNPVDEALLIGHVAALARGEALHRDFLDLYGPAHWWTQTLAYRLAGERVIGIRLWLLLLKLLGILLSFRLVARLAGRFHAGLCALWLVLLLGLRWQLLQSPYPFLQAWVISLLVLHLLLPGTRAAAGPDRRPATRALVFSGLLTGAAIWTKLNAGLFLLGGGLFVCAFLMPRTAEGPPGTRPLPRGVWLAGLLAYAAAFVLLLRPHLNVWFALYLLVPLALTVTGTGALLLSGRLTAQLRAPLLYAAAALVSASAILLITPGPALALDYLKTLSRVIAALDYTAPLPPIGQAGSLVGFNEHYWPQLPWLASLLALIWLVVTLKHLRRDRTGAGHGTQPARTYRGVLGMWAITSAHLCVMYSRPDESHIYQAMLLSVPSVFVLSAALTEPSVAPPGRGLAGRRLTGYRAALSAAVVSLGATLWAPPDLSPFQARPSPWANPHLAHIDFGPRDDPYVKAAFFHDRELVDARCNAAAQALDRVSPDGAPLLVLTRDELMPFNANMRAAGGRHRYLFYLLKNDFIDRAGFDALAPPDLLADLLDNPPRWIQGEPYRSPILDDFPELDALLRTRYRRVRAFGHVVLYHRTDAVHDRAVLPGQRGRGSLVR